MDSKNKEKISLFTRKYDLSSLLREILLSKVYFKSIKQFYKQNKKISYNGFLIYIKFR